ncbi:MAG: DUF1684 domain-containing protein [Bryobacteraceae bacterium]|nr:DUF1684 domain-containing protein [Bryobacteraceae bacterium]
MIRLLVVGVTALSLLSGYEGGVEEWRADREKGLKAEDGWLSLSGLFWLNEGENRIGSKAGARVQLPEGFPADVGVLFRKGDVVTFRAAEGAAVKLNGESTRAAELRTDRSGKPDQLWIGRLRLHVIQRGTKLGVRMKDPQSEARTHFTGLKWFPIQDDWRVDAKFVPKPRKLVVDAQAGDKQNYDSPGYVEWTRGGRTLRLTPVTEGDQLFFIFKDATSGKSTYAAARFIYTDMPKDGRVLLDFNKAYNPPCVFTPYATCPLPPPENRMTIAVEAGEKMYVGHGK